METLQPSVSQTEIQESKLSKAGELIRAGINAVRIARIERTFNRLRDAGVGQFDTSIGMNIVGVRRKYANAMEVRTVQILNDDEEIETRVFASWDDASDVIDSLYATQTRYSLWGQSEQLWEAGNWPVAEDGLRTSTVLGELNFAAKHIRR